MTSFIDEGMAKIRAAIALAPSHEEIFAGFKAMLEHLRSETKVEQEKPPIPPLPFAPKPPVPPANDTKPIPDPA